MKYSTSSNVKYWTSSNVKYPAAPDVKYSATAECDIYFLRSIITICHPERSRGISYGFRAKQPSPKAIIQNVIPIKRKRVEESLTKPKAKKE